MKRSVYGYGTLLGVGLCVVPLALSRPREATTRVDSGPVAERIVARGEVVASDGVVHVYALHAGRVARLVAREGDRVAAGGVLAEIDVAGTRESVTANAAGVVLVRRVAIGDPAAAAESGGEPLFELADPSRTELRIEVEEADAPRLATGQPVRIAPLGFSLPGAEGRVIRVAARVEPRSIGADEARVRAGGMVRVASVSWTGAAPAWPLAARAEATIEVRRREAAARVPRGALSVREGRTIVQSPVGFWTRELPVEVLSVDDAYAEIRGIAPGTEIVVPPGAGP